LDSLISLILRIDSPKDKGYNQVQFSTNFEPMVDGSFDYMQLNKIRPMSWLGFVFKGYSANPSFKTNISNISSKYHGC
jgi:predicted oxidoreductase